MDDRFKLLKILGITLKVLAIVSAVFQLIGAVGYLVARPPEAPPQAAGQFLFGAVLSFLILFTAGEIVKILLVIEQNTRKTPLICNSF